MLSLARHAGITAASPTASARKSLHGNTIGLDFTIPPERPQEKWVRGGTCLTRSFGDEVRACRCEKYNLPGKAYGKMKVIISAVMLSVAMVLAPPVNAQPTEDPDQFHWIKGQHICIAFRDNGVNMDTVLAIGRFLDTYGFNDAQKASVVAKSTEFWCPEYMKPLWQTLYTHNNREKGPLV